VAFTGSPLTDSDGDNNPDLVEYALGTNPASIASGPGALVVTRNLAGKLALTFPHNLLAENANCAVETTADFVTWTPAEFIGRSGTGATCSESWQSAALAGPKMFIRLRVTLAP
jgi:hypothetical protein